MLGMGKSKLFALIADGQLPARKIGAATVILHSDLITFLEHAPRAHGSGTLGTISHKRG